MFEINNDLQTYPGQAQRRRDPAFREKVLLAYEYRCCVCGHDLRMGGHAIGLEAAHIKWFQARGPSTKDGAAGGFMNIQFA